MAGHSLLKVMDSLGYAFIENLTSLGFYTCDNLVLLFGLELGVALIQTYVFIIQLVFIFRTEVN
jgi:hypothetical protein